MTITKSWIWDHKLLGPLVSSLFCHTQRLILQDCTCSPKNFYTPNEYYKFHLHNNFSVEELWLKRAVSGVGAMRKFVSAWSPDSVRRLRIHMDGPSDYQLSENICEHFGKNVEELHVVITTGRPFNNAAQR